MKLKYKLWDKRSNKWDNRYNVCLHGNGEIYADGQYNVTDHYEVVLSTLLKDKNGREIFEGDIVRQFIPTLKEYYSGEVYYSDWCRFEVGHGQWALIDSDSEFEGDYHDKWEICGNIYENPELLTPSPSTERK